MTTLKEVENARRARDPACAPCGPNLTLEQRQQEEKASETAKCEISVRSYSS
jgi:hypothetical protein